ncbi:MULTISPECIES: alpha/beta fold hydrolase [unclassified Oceanobacter]|uniref:alpha/beta fold hydrolase n=1 Tax=unclassified Oceanobacter TaxID=2620260 RepID=UPI0026E127CF|nr:MULTISPECIES: alpha/beta hydrolase [unclassified Oceanobacter]MDO6681000.1 alpha/beta hydrolase [Oceanobacter sp. 5_MG-2023]MDP2504428.1 alpha/beta hydrolase [Oceanobacter sp. 3_MG-2023]MDP2548324.1 alpha/beta hydrolase [Oceanobacter sp. 4_MG-2023]MDP2608661.1 alpha/beta hydrolase [Oceanobacter sp. 1_MG-2023]MDP2611757.1 alpha/beta hydrolase [Oceanobacter sp. 2_MG-2023]
MNDVSPAHTFSIASDSGQTFAAQLFMPGTEPTALIQIYHGMAEHWRRYQPLIRKLAASGYAVLAHNHQGHGERQPLGHLPVGHHHTSTGWQQLINDANQARQIALATLPESTPVILLGHSMGSFVVLTTAMHPVEGLAGLVLSGSGYPARWRCQLGYIVASVIAHWHTAEKPSALLGALAFAGYNQQIKQASGRWDWLTRDANQRQQYRTDPLCGFDCSAGFWQNLFTALTNITRENALASIPPQLPVLLLSGDQDPVGQYGRGIRALDHALHRSGHDQISTLLYPGGRHEMLNETNAGQVQSDLLAWLQNHLG